ncbi:MAG: hypothetical protein PHE06_04040 [Lachnospiraceae bacterium]|nr:hypothetical protein [Lachnospiraceae bacterium]MDD3795135.1 hypothetical protein [Lachnospiraceae bacterium]
MSEQNRNNGNPESKKEQNRNGGEQDWSENPALNHIDPAKLQMLLSMTDQAKRKNQNDLLPFLMAASSQSGSGKMNFSKDEIDTIINVLKMGKSPGEVRRIEKMCRLLKQMQH